MLEARDPGILTSVDDSSMWIASDYSGQHREAAFEAYAFLVTRANSLRAWNRQRIDFRAKCPPDGRRISFKDLRESMRWRALKPFLAITDDLQGNLIVVVIDKRFTSLFKERGPAISTDLPETFPDGTSNAVVDKTLRLGTVLSLLLAGLRQESQPATWISDQDEALEHYDRRERLGEFVSYTRAA
jgi:hypothetical protein